MNRIVKIVTSVQEYMLGISILVLALFACLQVFTRYAMNFSFSSYEEIGRFTCIFITFLGASIGIKRSSHFSMTAITDQLPFKAARFISMMVWLMTSIFCFVVTYYGTIHCFKQYQYETITPSLRMPMFIPFLPIPAFFFVMAIRSLFKVYEEFQRMIGGRDSTTETMATQDSPPENAPTS